MSRLPACGFMGNTQLPKGLGSISPDTGGSQVPYLPTGSSPSSSPPSNAAPPAPSCPQGARPCPRSALLHPGPQPGTLALPPTLPWLPSFRPPRLGSAWMFPFQMSHLLTTLSESDPSSPAPVPSRSRHSLLSLHGAYCDNMAICLRLFVSSLVYCLAPWQASYLRLLPKAKEYVFLIHQFIPVGNFWYIVGACVSQYKIGYAAVTNISRLH